MHNQSVLGHTPKWGENCFFAPTATLIGDVVLGDRVSVWYNVVVRGDVHSIRFGDECNIQDNTVVHGTYKKAGVTVGRRTTIGHNVTLHGCTLGEEVLVGMGSIIMDNAVVGNRCLVGAGSLITENSKFDDGMLIIGRPAKAVRPLNENELKALSKSADNYLLYKTWYEEELK
jgi:carbonic anhydrase/acetyltransferase-like protein (isoleucine patch superfamily)